MERRIRHPSIAALPDALRAPSAIIAARLGERGFRTWLVGGVVRDLALGITPHDADLTTVATPDDIEACFERTISVGRAFGTVVVVLGDAHFEVTTFRTESAYGDGRRPDQVAFGTTAEEDALRRDFTCNAMFLDPLTDELFDPTGGLEDLRKGLLRCVGDANERFGEDGLRLMRLARFAARLDLELETGTRDGARANAQRIQAVSGERILNEWTRIAEGRSPGRAVRLLDDVGVLSWIVGPLAPGAVERFARFDDDVEGAAVSVVALLSLLLEVSGGGGEALEHWSPSRALRNGIERAAALQGVLARAVEDGPLGVAERIRLLRDPHFRDALAVARTRYARTPAALGELEEAADAATESELWPEPLVTSADLDALAVARGPQWGRLLAEAEELQLDGALQDRDGALAWLRARIG